jgi:hypothetical protein
MKTRLNRQGAKTPRKKTDNFEFSILNYEWLFLAAWRLSGEICRSFGVF